MQKNWLDAYFERIEYGGGLDISLETLEALAAAHVFHIPFENLDIHMGRKIALDEAALVNKLIYQKRGGYCYEMNGLFALVLECLGFRFDRLMARILPATNELRPRTHQLSLVYLDNAIWLVDVGYGSRNLFAPMRLKDGYTAHQFSESYRILQENEYWYTLQGKFENEWKSFYTFTREKHLPIDYTLANYFNSTSPDSLFTRQRMAVLPNPNGRVVVVDNKLKIIENGKTEESEISSLEAYLETLQHYFGIVLGKDEISWPY